MKKVLDYYKNNVKKTYNKKNIFVILTTGIIFIGAIVLVSITTNSKQTQNLFTHASGTTFAPGTVPGCQFQKADGPVNVAFCDTFDQPMGIGNRSGGANGTVWGASRETGNVNLGSSDIWVPVAEQKCGQTVTVQPDNDIDVCNGQLVEGTNDGGTVTTLAMYPKQPFDFAGRTGTVTFDVNNDSQGNHEAWPEFWMSDQPLPAPFVHEASFQSTPRNGFGIRFAGCTDSSGNGNTCPGGSPAYVGVDSVDVIRNYESFDTFQGTGGNIQVIGFGSVKEPTQTGQLNHYELRISQNQIDVYGTDAYSGTFDATKTPLVHIATITNVNLSFTRGLIWLEDAHYNGDKFSTQRVHTFTWDNVGFDGPVLPRDLAFDVNDNNKPDTNTQANISGIDLGWDVPSDGTSSLSLQVPDISNIGQATGGLLTFDYYMETSVNLSYSLNGNPYHIINWPYPDTTTGSWRSFAQPIALSEVIPGTNTIQLKSSAGTEIANIDLIMAGAGGMPICYDPSNCAGTQFTGTVTGIPSVVTPTGVTPTLLPPTPTITPTPKAGSAVVSVKPSEINGNIGDTITLAIHEDSGSTQVNAAQATITYPASQFTETSIDYTGSNYGIQVQQIVNPGSITIARGSSAPLTGDQILGAIHLQATSSGTGIIGLNTIAVYTSSTNQNIGTAQTPGSINIVAPTPTATPTPKPTATPTPTPTNTPTATPTPIPLIGDLNHDGVVDILDVSILLTDYGTSSALSDLNHNGVVELADLSILLSHWTQ